MYEIIKSNLSWSLFWCFLLALMLGIVIDNTKTNSNALFTDDACVVEPNECSLYQVTTAALIYAKTEIDAVRLMVDYIKSDESLQDDLTFNVRQHSKTFAVNQRTGFKQEMFTGVQ